MEKVIEVANISKSFQLNKKQIKLLKTKSSKLKVIDNLSFDVYDGEILGILGANGAGKTTTLRLIAGLLKPDSGTINIKNTSKESKLVVSDVKIGFLTSDLKIDGYFTPSFIFDFYADLYNIPKQIAQKRKIELFEKFGIDKYAYVKIDKLSTGMKQKVSLVVSIAHDPQIIIYDEPTNGLDVISTKVVEEYILDLKEQGKTIILSTHIFGLVDKLCDRIIIIKEGCKVGEESIKTITSSQTLEDYFYKKYNNYKGDE